jgi:NADH-quinone oxidoreductase subunit D
MGLINIAVGPQHPALKEPIKFNFELDGERIINVDARVGYAHRGIEKGMEANTYTQGLYLIERICGICSHAHSIAFVEAVETLMEIEVPKRAEYIRCLIGELERLHSHLLWIGVLAHEIGFDTIFMYSWKDREVVMDTLEKISGNRVNYAINTFGGVKRDLGGDDIRAMLPKIKQLKERINYYLQVGQNEPSFIGRLKNVGILTKEQSTQLGAVGPTARAAGVPIDHRVTDTFSVYAELGVQICLEKEGDALARYFVRVRELMESCDIIERILTNIPSGEVKVKAPTKVKEGEAITRYEAPRGEDVHYLRANGTDKPDRYKVRAPTLANIPAVLHMLKDSYVADIPAIVASIDPCISCTDRAIALTDTHTTTNISWEQLRQHGIEWYK